MTKKEAAASDFEMPPAAREADEVLNRLFVGHTPLSGDQQISLEELKFSLLHETPLNMIVLAADIRKSTFIMKEAVSFRCFARIISDFVSIASDVVRGKAGGWFDKFTGDGFLAYWICNDEEEGKEIVNVFSVCQALFNHFEKVVMVDLRKNSKNLPAGVGLSFGIDSGPTQLVEVAGSLTVVGSPVVGAVRMVSAAQSTETLCNVCLGDMLYRDRAKFMQRSRIKICREYRQTKEYPSQEVYVLTFPERRSTPKS